MSTPRPTVHHGDCLAVLRTLPDESIDAVVTDPPYGLSNTDPKHVAETLTKWVTGDHEYTPSSPRKGRKNCLTEIVRGQEGDADNTYPEAREDLVHRGVTIDRSLAAMLGTVDLDDHVSVGEVEVDHVSPALALDDVLVHNAFAHLGQRGEDVELRLWARQGVARCVGECACFAELSTSVARVGVRLGYYAAGYPEGTAPVMTLRTTEVRAMLSFDARRGTMELTPADPADEVDLFTLVVTPKAVGAGTGTRGLPAVPQPDGVGGVDGAADWTFSLDLLAHETLLDRCFRPKDTPVGFMGKTWDSFVPPPAVWDECMRVLKPGGHLLVFAGTRTQDLMGLSIRLAGFDIRDGIGWIYGCLSEDTEVLINGEWVHYRNAKPGDLALCYDKDRDQYEWLPIEDTYEYDYSDTAYRVFSDRTDQIVSRNHRVLIERDGEYVFQLAEEAAREHEIRVPILESVSTLLDNLPLPYTGTGIEEPLLRSIVQRQGAGTVNQTPGASCDDLDCVRRMHHRGVETECVVKAGEDSDMLVSMQRGVAGGGMEEARPQGLRRVDGRVAGVSQRKDERTEQPVVERRGDVAAGKGQLCGGPIRPLSGRVAGNGPEGRVRDGASSCRCESDRSPADSYRGGASCEPSAPGQQAGESVSVRHESGSQTIRGARFTVTDLARIEPIEYRGKVWCLKVPTGAFVARRNGKVFATGNSGFPKSMDISKAIDKAAGAEREVVGVNPRAAQQTPKHDTTSLGAFAGTSPDLTAPATPEAERWAGWGTSLKPAIEPVIVARKPIKGTVAANVLAHGTGGINVDACRVPSGSDYHDLNVTQGGTKINGGNYNSGVGDVRSTTFKPAEGRFPPNVLLDPEAAAAMDEQSGVTMSKSGGSSGTHFSSGNEGVPTPDRPRGGHNDQGGASRFFPVFKYQAKAPAKERPQYTAEDGRVVKHATVKPLELMRWLVRLVTPIGGTVLDPFAGSGTTGEAAMLEGFDSILIEGEAEHLPLIDVRIERSADDTTPPAPEPEPTPPTLHDRITACTSRAELADLYDEVTAADPAAWTDEHTAAGTAHLATIERITP